MMRGTEKVAGFKWSIYRCNVSSGQPHWRTWCLYTALRDPDCIKQTPIIWLQHRNLQTCRSDTYIPFQAWLWLLVSHVSDSSQVSSMSEDGVGTRLRKFHEAMIIICGATQQKQTTKQGQATEQQRCGYRKVLLHEGEDFSMRSLSTKILFLAGSFFESRRLYSGNSILFSSFSLSLFSRSVLVESSSQL